jgi:hypothetical protein
MKLCVPVNHKLKYSFFCVLAFLLQCSGGGFLISVAFPIFTVLP